MISQELQDKIQKVIESRGLNLYDIEILKENNSLLLRVSLFKKSGVTLQDCEEVSTIISPLLDVELEKMENYTLEVSSPGLERTLKKPEHFAFSTGELIELKLVDKTNVRGILKGFSGGIISIKPYTLNSENTESRGLRLEKIDKTEPKTTLEIPLTQCKRVRTIFEFYK